MHIYLFDPLCVLFGPVSLPEVPGLGCQMPGNGVELADLLAAPDPGNVWVLVNGVPVQLPDHRGPVFRVDTGEELEWEELGELPEGYTPKPYPGEYHVWLNGGWVLDASAETAGLAKLALLKRDTLMSQATTVIAPLQDAVDLGLETPEKVALLRLWKRYRIDLSDVEQQAGFPVNIDWPTPLQLEGGVTVSEVPKIALDLRLASLASSAKSGAQRCQIRRALTLTRPLREHARSYRDVHRLSAVVRSCNSATDPILGLEKYLL